jgi:hypothetical protein
MVVRVRLVVVDRNGRMVLVPEPDLVVEHGTVGHRTLAQAVGVMVMKLVLEVADLVGVVYHPNRPTQHHYPQAADLQA